MGSKRKSTNYGPCQIKMENGKSAIWKKYYFLFHIISLITVNDYKVFKNLMFSDCRSNTQIHQVPPLTVASTKEIQLQPTNG